MKLFFILFFALFLPPHQSLADSEIQRARFEGPLKILESVFRDYDGSEHSLESVTQKMLRGPRRVATFQLQALGQIYQKYEVENSKTFFKHTLRFSAKSLEDAIGGYDKWNEILKNLQLKGGSESQIETAKNNKDIAYQILVYVLSGKIHWRLQKKEQLSTEHKHFLERYQQEKSLSLLGHLEWIGTTPSLAQGLRTHIDDWTWLNASEDRTYVIKQLRKHLKNLDNTEFNFKLLEDTPEEKGLHEFRREVRWFSFQVGVLNGTVNFYDTFLENKTPDCPSADLAQLTDPQKYPELAKSPYSKLPMSPFPDEDLCGISRCLFYKMTQIVSDIGEIKDIVEKGNFQQGSGNTTPDWAADGAQRIFDDMKKSEVIIHLRSQLKACYDK